MLKKTKLTDKIGVSIIGVDESNIMADESIRFIKESIFEHQLVHISDLEISDDDLLKFASFLGDVRPHARKYLSTKNRELITDLDHAQGDTIPSGWHMDTSFFNSPPAFTMLRPKILPLIGGDTLFSSLIESYNELSDTFKDFLSGLVGVHESGYLSLIHSIKMLRYWRDNSNKKYIDIDVRVPSVSTEHPLVYSDETDIRKSIFINPFFLPYIKNLKPRESKLILDFLLEHSIQNHLIYRHKWRLNDLIISDNLRSFHNAHNDYADRRKMNLLHIYLPGSEYPPAVGT